MQPESRELGGLPQLDVGDQEGGGIAVSRCFADAGVDPDRFLVVGDDECVIGGEGLWWLDLRDDVVGGLHRLAGASFAEGDHQPLGGWVGLLRGPAEGGGFRPEFVDAASQCLDVLLLLGGEPTGEESAAQEGERRDAVVGEGELSELGRQVVEPYPVDGAEFLEALLERDDVRFERECAGTLDGLDHLLEDGDQRALALDVTCVVGGVAFGRDERFELGDAGLVRRDDLGQELARTFEHGGGRAVAEGVADRFAQLAGGLDRPRADVGDGGLVGGDRVDGRDGGYGVLGSFVVAAAGGGEGGEREEAEDQCASQHAASRGFE